VPPRIPKMLAASAVTVLALVACAGNQESAAPTTSAAPPVATSAPEAVSGQAAVNTPAAELRAGLTHLLTEHVYTAAIALKYAVDNGGNLEDPTVKAAVANLDANSVALSQAIGAAYPAAEEPFLASWRQHIGFFVDYTLGTATNDQFKIDKAEADLDGYRTSFGQLINSVVPELSADAVAQALVPHVDSVLATIDSLVAGDGQVFARLVAAADHMPGTAATLAGGIAENKDLDGDVDAAASELRSGLTYLLTSHVDLAGIALAQAVSEGGDLQEPSVQAAVAALDTNSVALSEAIGAAYPDAEEPFLASWRQHIGFFVDYTLGTATKDQAKVDKARADLEGYRTSFGQLISSVVPELPADVLAEALVPHVNSVFATIDSLVAADGQVFTKLAEASAHMPDTATALAGGIAENKDLS